MLCCLHKSFYKKCPKNHVFAIFAKHKKTAIYIYRVCTRWFTLRGYMKKGTWIELWFYHGRGARLDIPTKKSITLMLIYFEKNWLEKFFGLIIWMSLFFAIKSHFPERFTVSHIIIICMFAYSQNSSRDLLARSFDFKCFKNLLKRFLQLRLYHLIPLLKTHFLKLYSFF